jgi:hypothetical protein
MTNFVQLVELTNRNQGSVMAVLTLVYVLTTIGLALIALRSVHLTGRQLTLAVELERNRTRPFILLDLVNRPPWVLAVVKNIGQTAGLEVKFKLSPELKILLGGKNMVPREERELDIPFITQGIAVMPPGREIETLIGTWSRVESRHPNLHFEGIVSYKDTQGREYSEPALLDLNSLKGLLHRGAKDIGDVAKQLEEISKELHHIGTGYHKPLIRTLSEDQYRREEEEAIEQALQHHEGQKQPDSGAENKGEA